MPVNVTWTDIHCMTKSRTQRFLLDDAYNMTTRETIKQKQFTCLQKGMTVSQGRTQPCHQTGQGGQDKPSAKDRSEG